MIQTNKRKEHKLELFYEVSEDFLCIGGFDGYFKRVNPAFIKALGFAEHELFSKPINQFIHPEDRDRTEIHRETLRKNTSLIHFENRYITKKGEIIWLSWTSIPLVKDEVIYAIAKDITQKKQMEEERYHLLSNLSTSNKNLKQLSYRTSHDLRSPVNNIISLLSLMDISKINDEETLELLELLKISTDGLKETLNEFVDTLSKKEDNLYIPINELNLNNTLEIVKNSIKSLLENSKTTFKIDFTEAPTLKFNKAYLESIFLNLITNSIKYTKPNCPPEISISTKKTDFHTQIIFSDQGLGFDMEKDGDKIFGLHQKFHHNTDSKGVGLYLIYNHVTNLGGRIEVKSNPNEGVTFIISIPN